MLLKFAVENFRSIRERQELSLVASRLGGRRPPVPSPNAPEGILTVAAIYGANASGKSNLLEGLRFMRSAVLFSQTSWPAGGTVPVTPFALDAQALGRPSVFSIDVEIDAIRYEYGFALDQARVQREWLYAYPQNRRQVWFERDVQQPSEFRFGKHFTGPNKAIERLTRPNSLFLSAASQNNHPLSQQVVAAFLGIDFEGRFKFEGTTKRMCAADTGFRQWLERELQAADLGIVGVQTTVLPEEPPSDEQVKLLGALRGSFGPRAELPTYLLQKSPDIEVDFIHRGAGPSTSAAIRMDDESAGTRVWFSLLGPAYQALTTGGILCVDELDASLHPRLVGAFVRLFVERQRNPKHAQLLFTTHDTHLLDALRRDEIWFVEKDSGGATHVYPLTDYKPRADERIQRGYVSGKYGAVPVLDGMVLADE